MPPIQTREEMTPESPHHLPSKTLILGLGNDILTDDGVGLAVVRRLASRYAESENIVLRETMEMGLALLDFLVGFNRVIIVDSLLTGQKPPGTIHEVDVTGWQELTGSTPHFLGVGETLALGRQLGLAMPQQVTVLGIEVQDPYTLGTELSQAVASAVPDVVRRVEHLLPSPTPGRSRRNAAPTEDRRGSWERVC
jgi:hydrogenase maturation protease